MNEEISKDEVMETPGKLKSKRNKIIIGVVGVVVICCCCIGLLMVTSSDSTEDGESAATVEVQEQDVTNEEAAVAEVVEVAEVEPTSTELPTDIPATLVPTNTPAPTDTPAATNTPAPTDTPAATNTPAPTDTPAATNTPAPTSTPAPTNTPDSSIAEELYRLRMVEVGAEYATAFDTFSGLMTEVGEDSSLLVDDDWRIDVAVLLVTIRFINEDVQALDPPNIFMNVHNHMLNATEHYDNFIQLFTEGIDELDVDKLLEATDELTLGNADINLATEAVSEVDY